MGDLLYTLAPLTIPGVRRDGAARKGPNRRCEWAWNFGSAEIGDDSVVTWPGRKFHSIWFSGYRYGMASPRRADRRRRHGYLRVVGGRLSR
jgi:hypothetical protein